MDSDGIWSALATTIGGFAVVGLLLDFAMCRWWASLDPVETSAFGATEAARALAIMDRWAGPRLWSWPRGRATLLVAGFWLVLGFVWLSVSLHWMDMGDWTYAQRFPSYWAVDELVIPHLMILASVVLFFPVSLSVFRGVARLTIGWSPRGARGFLLFAVMLLVHLAMLLYWNSLVVLVVIGLPSDLAVHAFDGWDFVAELNGVAYDTLKEPLLQPLLFPWSGDPVTDGSGYHDLALLMKSALDLTSNGLRLGFALIFLGSWRLRPILHLALGRFPLFAILSAIVGAVWALGSALMG